MGIFFTLLYVLMAYVEPSTVFGEIAQYHVELIIAMVALTFGFFSAEGSGLSKLPQTVAFWGLTATVSLSLLSWGFFGIAVAETTAYLPNALSFYMVVLNCRKKSHLQMLVLVLFATAAFTVYLGNSAAAAGDYLSPYVLRQLVRPPVGPTVGPSTIIFRIRGLSFLNDPNDLSQFMVGLIPCMFFFWGKGKSASNFFLVYLPTAVLLYGMYLTHSRGGMVAIVFAAIVAGRKKIGVLRSTIIGGVLFVGLTAVGWTGGRDVSGAAGEDRMGAWSEGLTLIKMRPFLGVGYKRFVEYYPITAHNTVVVCAAELGMIGFFFWMMFVLPTVRDVVVGSNASEAEEAEQPDKMFGRIAFRRKSGTPEPAPPAHLAFSHAALATPGGDRIALQPKTIQRTGNSRQLVLKSTEAAAQVAPRLPDFLHPSDDSKVLSEVEFRRLCNLMVISFAGFLAAGWFLSRAFTMTLFINAGMAIAIVRIGREAGFVVPPWPLGRAAKVSAVASIIGIIVVYIILRVNNLFGS